MSVVKIEVQCTILRFTFKTLKGLHLLEKFFSFYERLRVYYRVHKSPPIVYIQSQIKLHCSLGTTVRNLITRNFGTPDLGHFQRNHPLPRLCITFCNMLISYGEDMSAACRNSRWRTTTRLLSAIVYSFYSQLPCIFGGHILHPQAEDALYCGDIEPLSMP
jgi:hypothetical protein